MGLFGWADSDEDLMSAQETSVAGQFVQQWNLRVRAQEEALGGVVDINLRWLLG